jgi:tetratricopeptide (TPR) repeat protein
MLVSVRQKVTEHKYAEAEALARRAEKAAGRNVEMRARALGELGYVLSAELKFEPAAEAINESLKLRKSRMTTAAEMDDMAVQLQNLAGLQRRAGQRPAARKSMDEATALVEKTHGKNAEVTQLFRNAARAFPKQ